jgi:nanoRNase/pAp phosphatase (c-di-AMP/oligoRNAs hydrolase)
MDESFFSYMKSEKILLLCHEHADLDSLASAAIMQRLLSARSISSSIAIPSHINEQALNFAQKEKISFQTNPDLAKFSCVLLFDFNDFEMLGSLRPSFEELFFRKKFKAFAFDHHTPEKRSIDSSESFIGKGFSTTQLLLSLFVSAFDQKCFFYCALGIMEDTGHFTVGNQKLFSDFSFCLEQSGKSFVDVLSLSKHFMKRGERIALLKASQRAEIIEVNDTIIVTSTVSFFQSQAASKLLEFGADISLVSGMDEKSGLSVLSCRADSVFKESKKFNLVRDLLVPLQEKIGGEIGGHSGAAQWKGNYDYLLVLEESISILKQLLK